LTKWLASDINRPLVNEILHDFPQILNSVGGFPLSLLITIEVIHRPNNKDLEYSRLLKERNPVRKRSKQKKISIQYDWGPSRPKRPPRRGH